MTEMLSKKRNLDIIETSDDDEGLVPERLLRIEKKANKQLEKELERV